MQNKPARCGSGLENRVSPKAMGFVSSVLRQMAGSQPVCVSGRGIPHKWWQWSCKRQAAHAGLTQLVEYLFCNQMARDSSPRFSTNGDDVGKSYSMRTPQRSSRLANPCTPLTEVPNAGLLYAAYHKGGSFPSKASSQEQDLRVATIDIHLVFHHILSGKYLWLRLGVFFLQIELEIRVEAWYNINR